MATLEGLAGRFLALHDTGRPLLQPNAWDAGSARVLEALGFEAIATTSGGFALTLGRRDGTVTRDEALAHSAQVAGAVDVPVAADSENCFADDPAGVPRPCACSPRPGWRGARSRTTPARPRTPSTTRCWPPSGWLPPWRLRTLVRRSCVITARAENLIHGRDDLADTIARLQRSRRQGPTSSSPPGCARSTTSGASCHPSIGPVNVLARPVPAGRRAGRCRCPTSRSAAGSRTSRWRP